MTGKTCNSQYGSPLDTFMLSSVKESVENIKMPFDQLKLIFVKDRRKMANFRPKD